MRKLAIIVIVLLTTPFVGVSDEGANKFKLEPPRESTGQLVEYKLKERPIVEPEWREIPTLLPIKQSLQLRAPDNYIPTPPTPEELSLRISPIPKLDDVKFEYSTGRLHLAPIASSWHNQIEGHNMFGYSGYYELTPSLRLGMSSYFSSGYFGQMVPERINNVTFGANLQLKVSDNLTLFGRGNFSLDRGIDPKYMSMNPNAHSYGFGGVLKITDNISIVGGVERSYFRGKWRNSYYVVPVINFD